MSRSRALAATHLCPLTLVAFLGLACGEPAPSTTAPSAPATARVQATDPQAANRALYDPNARVPEMSDAEILETIRQMNRLWHLRKAVFRSRFLGIPTQQNPADAWIVQELLSEVAPDLMIETGTFQGGSALLWAMVLGNVNSHARVITIDIADQRRPEAKSHALAQRVDFLLGSSADPEIVSEVHRRAEGLRTLVLLDSLHTAEHVAKELAAYAPLVPVGSYVIVQDSPLDAITAIDAFLAENPGWEVDAERERFGITNTMRGYLKRVR